MKPRVVILSAFLSPLRSGAEACAEEIAVLLAERFDITILTARLRKDLPKEELLRGRVPVKRLGFGSPFDKWLFPFLAPFAARTLQPQLVHAILETFAGFALLLCRYVFPPAKRLLTLQTMNREFLKRWIVRSPDRVTAISTALRKIAEGFERNDVVVIPNGIVLAAIVEAVERTKRVPGRILFVGRLERVKGVDVLLDAFEELLRAQWQHLSANAHVRIVGDGSERETFEQLAIWLHIGNRVTFVGAVPPPAVYEEFAQAEIFCGLSRSEALGNVFLEAQAAGCAVVATRVGGIPDIVQDGITGLLVPPNDANAARGALGRVLRDGALRRTIAEQGRVHAQQYDWGIIAEMYGQVYDQLLVHRVIP